MSEIRDKIHIQHEIIKLLDKNNSSKCTFHFEVTEGTEQLSLHLMSYNPQHKKKFLFHSEAGIDEIDAYNRMLLFVQELPDSKDNKNYEILWSDSSKGNQRVVSYFFGKSEFDALYKLYYDNNKDNVTFLEMRLVPLS